jgi:hypothetical protein
LASATARPSHREESPRAAAMDDCATLGFVVIALNVTKLGSDNIDPRVKRLEDWKLRVEASGGRWRVINDLDRLDPAFLG